MPHVFFCTGEVSGDLQASYLIKALLHQRPDLSITAVGGERMAAAGATLIHNTTAISSIGLIEAIPLLGPALWAEWKIRRYLRQHPPDLCILVDYIGVNSRISALLQTLKIPAVYYIAPQEWVWSATSQLSYRLAEHMRLMLAIFPQEAEHYQQAGGNVRWVGHPLIDILQHAPRREQARVALGIPPGVKAVMLLPASRPQELTQVAPVLFAAAKMLQEQMPDVGFWLPLASPRYRHSLLKQASRAGIKVTVLDPHAMPSPHYALAAADLVLAKSGTVNLETALLKVPQVVVYRVHPFTYWLARHVLRFSVPFISPPNLVLKRQIIPEFLQKEAQAERVAREGYELLTNPLRRSQLLQDYLQMRLMLGEPGVLQRAASEILKLLKT